MINIDFRDRRPIYEQIVRQYEDLILNGALKADEQIPSVRQLAMELSINPNTIQRAYMELEKKNIIYSVKGKGNFVSSNQEPVRKEKEENLIQKIRCIAIESAELSIPSERMIKEFEEFYKREKEGRLL